MTSIVPADKTSRDELAATGADATIVWGVSIGFGAILTGAALTLGVTATATASSGTGQQSSRSVRFA